MAVLNPIGSMKIKDISKITTVGDEYTLDDLKNELFKDRESPIYNLKWMLDGSFYTSKFNKSYRLDNKLVYKLNRIPDNFGVNLIIIFEDNSVLPISFDNLCNSNFINYWDFLYSQNRFIEYKLKTDIFDFRCKGCNTGYFIEEIKTKSIKNCLNCQKPL